MVENTARLTKRFESEGVRLAIENLNPRAGYLLIHPDEMIEIANRKEHYLTLDIGHLYVSSALFDLDFLYEIRRVMETGRVVNVHLHSNASNKEKLIFEDSHSSLVDESFPYKEALDILRETSFSRLLMGHEKAQSISIQLFFKSRIDCKKDKIFHLSKNCRLWIKSRQKLYMYF